MPSVERYAPQALAVLRIVTALLFIEHGTSKIFGFPPSEAGGGGSPEGFMAFVMTLGAWMELIGGLALLTGYLTRPVAFLLAGEMAVAFWFFHAPNGFFPVSNGGDAAVLYCFIFLYLFIAGPGAFALDNAGHQRTGTEPSRQRAPSRYPEPRTR